MPRLTGRGESLGSLRADILATAAIIGIAVAVVGGSALARVLGPHPTRAECEALLDRYVEAVARAADPDVKQPAIDTDRARSRALAAKATGLDRCPAWLSPGEAACAARAMSADEIERCIE